jgi:pimeloyl-ACP methyl ester carboxylesterase
MNVVGRQTVGDFRDLTFSEQIELVANDLRTLFWHREAKVIANSFGAYLFLHAQNLLPPYVGRVLLLSPIVGPFENEERMMIFEPPRPGQLQAMTQAGTYPVPCQCEIYVGELDWQSNRQPSPSWPMHGVTQLRWYLVVNTVWTKAM